MHNNEKNKGYSVLIALFMVGFLIVVTSGIFNLVLREMKDNRGMGDYLRAYAGAEGAQELALLQIKTNGYGYYDKIEHNKNNRSVVLSRNPLDLSLFKDRKEVFISYEIQSKTSTFSGVINKLEYSIIPLFYNDDLGIHSTKKIGLNIISGNPNDLAWNIVGTKSGLSGTGTFSEITLGIDRKISANNLSFQKTAIEDFLALPENSISYLILFNSNNIQDILYNISGIHGSNLFTKPESIIISSAEVGGYKQTLKTKINNTEYLNLLRYSIFSN